MPDAYLTVTPEGIRPRDRCFFLNYLDDGTPFFVHVRRLQKYIDYIEAEEWEDATSSKLRGILLVCESTALLIRIRKKLARIVDEDETPHLRSKAELACFCQLCRQLALYRLILVNPKRQQV